MSLEKRRQRLARLAQLETLADATAELIAALQAPGAVELVIAYAQIDSELGRKSALSVVDAIAADRALRQGMGS